MESKRHVRPLSPVVPHIGGKRKLAPRILPYIEAVAHTCYAEVFVGMGGIFLQRRQVPSVEVINDRSRDVSTFFRVLQRHYVPFLDMVRWQITSRAEFLRLVDTDPDTLTDLERSARFLYLQACAYGGKRAGQTFGVSPESARGFNLTRLQPLMEAVHDRLAGVVIENLDYTEFLSRYDAPGTLFYLDPPYFGSEDEYGPGLWARHDFRRLADQLAGIEGRFILSINDTPEMRDTFGGFGMEVVDMTYTVARSAAKRVQELIITGPAARTWEPGARQAALL